MMPRWSKHLTLALVCGATLGCHLPGRPGAEPEVPRPEDVHSFAQLYGQNCAGCHGADGRNGAATELANPEYEALIDDASLRNVVANGEKGTLMPGFAQSGGGNLTDSQIDAIVSGMRARWGRPGALSGTTLPPWHATQAGDAGRGATVYAQACARCHGPSGQQPGPAGSILDGSFLGVTNDQTIRTTIIAGRDDIGQPDWRSVFPGRPLTDSEITDVTAWIIAQTPPHPGHPYPSAQPTSERPGEQQPLGVTRNPQPTQQQPATQQPATQQPATQRR